MCFLELLNCFEFSKSNDNQSGGIDCTALFISHRTNKTTLKLHSARSVPSTLPSNVIWFDEEPVLDVADVFLKACSRGTMRREGEQIKARRALSSPLLCTLSPAHRQEINPLWLIRTAIDVTAGFRSQLICALPYFTCRTCIAFMMCKDYLVSVFQGGMKCKYPKIGLWIDWQSCPAKKSL